MLLPREQSPWNCGYYLGAMAFRILKHGDAASDGFDIHELQRAMSDLTKRELSLTQVVSAVSWLYMLGVVDADERGAVMLCI